MLQSLKNRGKAHKHMVLSNLLGKDFHLFILLLLDEFLSSLHYMLDSMLGAAYTGMNTADLIPALIEFIVDQERLTLNNLNCYSWAKRTKEEWAMDVEKLP